MKHLLSRIRTALVGFLVKSAIWLDPTSKPPVTGQADVFRHMISPNELQWEESKLGLRAKLNSNLAVLPRTLGDFATADEAAAEFLEHANLVARGTAVIQARLLFLAADDALPWLVDAFEGEREARPYYSVLAPADLSRVAVQCRERTDVELFRYAELLTGHLSTLLGPRFKPECMAEAFVPVFNDMDQANRLIVAVTSNHSSFSLNDPKSGGGA